MSQHDGGQPPPPPPPQPADRQNSPSDSAPQPQLDMQGHRHMLGDVAAHPSAASLSRLDLPLSPVVAPPVGSPRGTGSSPFNRAVAATGQGASGAAAPRSPRSPPAAGASPLRTHSSRLFSAANLRRPGTEVWTFGRGDCGQLGSGRQEDAHAPQPVEGLQGRDVVNLAAGTLHTAAVTADGELYVCGSNDSCQLGIRRCQEALVPTRVEALEAFSVQCAACGPANTLAVVDDGALAACGSSEFGQAGLGAVGTQVELPKVVKDLRSMHITRVAAGGSHTLALSSTGGVFSFGNGSFGALGRGTTEGTDVPRPISRLWPLGVVQVACGDAHSAALLADGRLLTWGRGRYGALGHGDLENRSTPQAVRALAGVAGCQLSCGDDHTVLLAANGSVWTCGRGTWGQTGQGHTEDICYPKQVSALAGRRIVQVSAGGRHTLALDSSNQLLAFGNNESGQCGGPASPCQPSPRLVEGLPFGCPVLFVVAGGDHSAVVVDRGGSVQSAAIGPCLAQRPHGEQWCALPLPDLLQLTGQVAAAQQADRASVEAVIAAVEMLFSSPGYLLQAFSRRHREQQQQQQQQSNHQAQQQQDKRPEQQQGQQQHHQQQQQQQAGEQQMAAAGAEPMDIDQAPGAQHAQQGAAQQHGASEAQQPQQQQEPAPAAPRQGDGCGGLDVPRIAATYQALLRLYDPAVVTALGSTCVRLLDILERFLNSLAQQQQDAAAGSGGGGAARQDLSWLAPLLFVLLQNPLNSETGSFGGKLLMRICRIVTVTVPLQERLQVRQALQALLARLPADTLAARCVRPVQRYIDSCVTAGLGATRVQVIMAGVLLDILRQANEDAGGIIPYTEFHSRSLSEHANLQAEYLAMLQNKDSSALVSLCQMPYLLTPEAKARIMHGEAAMQQQQHLSAAAMQGLFQGISPAAVAFLEIHVRRTHVVEDALNQLVHRAEDLKKPLRVTFFSGGVPEPAQDAGGVTKEFFQILTRDLFKPKYGMFVFDEQTRTYWFNPASLETEVEYALVGAVLGLAIYNGVILDVHFPMVVYKKLLGVKPSFEDLKAAFPALGRGLQQLLDFEPAEEVEATFCRKEAQGPGTGCLFTVEYDFYGELRVAELKPGGADIPVTAANRREYVQLYTGWLLEGSIASQFTAFRRGFLRVCSGPALTLFTPAELELLICGLPHLDFEALQRVAKYEGGYTQDSSAVRWFWQVLQGLSLEQKRAFLQFTTGSDRAPVGGLGKMHLLIQRAGPDTDRLPTSHTCFNSLLLPDYSSREKLRAKLLTAVGNAQGFGLQ
ncbi:hypothetical protein ABPG75_009562 [Micractinium tetrahymenae]